MSNDAVAAARERTAGVTTVAELARLLRQLRRREARRRGGSELTYRELAASTGWSHAIIGQYFTGKVLPPTDRFDTLVRLLAATAAEQGALATARDRVADSRRAAASPVRTAAAATVAPVAAVAAAAVRRDAGRVVPAQLPADPVGFTGRIGELSELDNLLSDPATDGTAMIVAAVSGTAGAGKTALVVHWAHRSRDAFPDGQLYVDLRGYDPEEPVPAGDALAGFLRALGVPGPDIPLELAERAARFRTEIAGRRTLVVLDNASSVEQVRPLLPGTASCVVVVTSRDALVGLVAQHGARRLRVDQLPAADALALLRRLVGAAVTGEPAAAATLAAQCARLPLALRVAAELAVARAPTPLSDLVAELADLRRRLDLLDAGGDPRAAVRAVLSWSYQHLPAGTARGFRLLGLHPGTDWDAAAAAALTGAVPDQAGRMLAALTRAHLVQATGPGRYGMHDLLRAYAADLATATDPATERRAALTRLFDHLAAVAGTAVGTLFPAEAQRRCRPGPGAGAVPAAGEVAAAEVAAAEVAAAEVAAARSRLDAERLNIVAAAAHAAEHGWPQHAVDLARAMFRYFDSTGRAAEALAIHGHAVRAAGSIGDHAGQAHALIDLSGVHWRQARYDQAIEHVDAALALHRQVGDRGGEARALASLGRVYGRQGRYAVAADRLRTALALFGQLGDPVEQARTLDHLGHVATGQGRLAEAVGLLQRALTLFGRAGDDVGAACARVRLGAARCRQHRYDEAADELTRALTWYRGCGHPGWGGYALTKLGLVRLRQGRPAEAADHLQDALDLHRRGGDRTGQAQVHVNLGLLCCARGAVDAAADHLQGALAVFRSTHDPAGEADALAGLGETAQAAGRPRPAAGWHADALAVATRIGDTYQQARAHAGLATAMHTIGRLNLAHEHDRLAVAGYTEVGVPVPVQRRLTLDNCG